MKNLAVKITGLLFVLLSAKPAQATNLIFNGDFESGLNASLLTLYISSFFSGNNAVY